MQKTMELHHLGFRKRIIIKPLSQYMLGVGFATHEMRKKYATRFAPSGIELVSWTAHEFDLKIAKEISLLPRNSMSVSTEYGVLRTSTSRTLEIGKASTPPAA